MIRQRLLAIRRYSCLLFPGQGAQYVGMTSKILKIPAVQSLFKQANDILGYDLQSLCLKGPDDTLRKTEYCQPAVVVCSLAAAAAAHKVPQPPQPHVDGLISKAVVVNILHHLIAICE